MAKRRLWIAALLMFIIVFMVILLFTLNETIRNAPLAVGGATLNNAEITLEVTAEDDSIPVGAPPRALTFASNRDGSWDLFHLLPDGTLINLTGETEPRGAHDYFPSWSLDGAQINFLSNRLESNAMGPSQMRPDGSDLRNLEIVRAVFQIIQDRRFDWDPSWSSRGQMLWSSLRDLNLELYRIAPDAEFVIANATRLTSDAGRDWFASWSMDDTQIVFSSDRAGNEDVYVMSAAGGETLALTTDVDDEIWGMWSLDGERIAYVFDREGALARGEVLIYTVSPNGGDQGVLADVFEGDATWTVDGRYFAYVSNKTGRWQIYMRDIETERTWRVSPDGADALFPVWRP